MQRYREALVRTVDRLVIQFGYGLGEVLDENGAEVVAEVVQLTEQQSEAIVALFETGNVGKLFISAAGAVTSAAPPPPPPDPLLASRVLLWRYLPASGHANAAAIDAYLAGAAADDPLALTIRALRAAIRVTRGGDEP